MLSRSKIQYLEVKLSTEKKTAVINFLIEPSVKEKADEVAKNLGLSTAQLMRLYVSRVAQDRKIPFRLKAAEKRLKQVADEQAAEYRAKPAQGSPYSVKTVHVYDDARQAGKEAATAGRELLPVPSNYDELSWLIGFAEGLKL